MVNPLTPHTNAEKMKTKSSLTPYPDVNEILNFLLSEVQQILREQFVGMYLFGSLANGDFDEQSDIDVLIVTDGEISKDSFSALEHLHKRINELDSPWALQIEASYIPRSALRRYDPAHKLHPHMDRGEGETLHMMSHESDWIIQRHILRERGIVITGPILSDMIDPVSPDELCQAVVDVLPLWTQPILDQPTRINRRGYQSYCVLTLCRMVYTLKYGEILSKPAAANWALGNLDSRWKPLIERARIGRQNPNVDADPGDISETLDMMRYILQQIRPTRYPDVNEVLNLLLSHVKKILADQFVGMYLYGSLSSSDFDPESSDIDFLVVTTATLSDRTISELEAMHNRIWAGGAKWASRLEGSYVQKELIRRHDPNGLACPAVNEGKFYVAALGSDWIIQRHIIREMGVVVEGPSPQTLIDFVTPEEIRGAVLGVLQEWWFPMLDDPSWLRERGSEYHAFAVITMCRALHALEHGTVLSKPKTVEWARSKLGEAWQELIDKAVAASRHEKQSEFLNEALNFIRFVRVQTAGLKRLTSQETNHAQGPS